MKLTIAISAAAVGAALLFGPSTSQAQDTTKAPPSSAQSKGSKVGKALDKAGSDTKHETKRTGKHIGTALHKTGKAIQKAGHDVKAETQRDVKKLTPKKDTTRTP
ncbi:MAG: hypothetical protein M3081_14490 [Gemmatimonadota bacterium]|nr:hypothetical protein [Gemmatimonadota bacterium]